MTIQAASAVQTAIGDPVAIAAIIQHYHVSDSVDEYYVRGGPPYIGRSRWVQTTSTDSAATQAAALLAGLLA